MLKKNQTIKGRRQFAKIIKSVKPQYFDILKIWSVKGINSASQFGIMVSKKVSSKAVVRNRLKRQLKAILKEALKQEIFQSPTKAIFSFYKTPDPKKSYDLIKADIQKWQKKLF